MIRLVIYFLIIAVIWAIVVRKGVIAKWGTFRILMWTVGAGVGPVLWGFKRKAAVYAVVFILLQILGQIYLKIKKNRRKKITYEWLKREAEFK
ncbi:MAG: hypothetical protein PHN74_00560 [Candidatus Pacebacteria bacterium]|nr:hypothetical protein [Candidatus Paceibacterota bacterium]